MLDQNKVNSLAGLVRRGKITLDQIKDEEYREAVRLILEGV